MFEGIDVSRCRSKTSATYAAITFFAGTGVQFPTLPSNPDGHAEGLDHKLGH